MFEEVKRVLTDKFFELLRSEIAEKAFKTGNMYRAVRKDSERCQIWIDEAEAPYAFYVNYGTRYMTGKFFVEQAMTKFEDFCRGREWKVYLEGLFVRSLERISRS